MKEYANGDKYYASGLTSCGDEEEGGLATHALRRCYPWNVLCTRRGSDDDVELAGGSDNVPVAAETAIMYRSGGQ